MLDFSKVKTEWDFTHLLPDETDVSIEKDLKQAEDETHSFVNKWKSRDDYLTDPTVLKIALDEFEALNSAGGVSGNAGYYIALKSSVFQDDPVVKARESKIDERTLKLGSELDFFVLRISKISPDEQPKFLSAPDLAEYAYFLKTVFENGKYMLTEPEEKVLTLMSPPAYGNWVKMTSEFISTEERDVLGDDKSISSKNFSDLLSMLSSPDIEVRENVAKAINNIFTKHIKVGEAELNSVLGYKKTVDNLRGYVRADQASHIIDNIDSATVDLLLDVVSSNNQIVHKYYELKAKLLNLSNLKYYERNILYSGMDKKYSFEDSAHLVYNTMFSLDPMFAQIFEKYLHQGRIDVFTKKGKTSMEYCSVSSKQQPAYVLLNFAGKTEDVSTIAHEMGHALNDDIVKLSQNSLNMGIPLCLAETASTFFEDFVLDEIEKTMSDQEKLALMIFRLDSAINTVFRQVACYRFEQDLHNSYRERGFISKDYIGELFMNNMSAYCGPFVDISGDSQNWWLHWPHIRSFFYVYSYAFGYLVSKYMQALVRTDANNISAVKTFLSAGSAKGPKEILLDINIDINSREFWQKGIDQIGSMLNATEEFAKKLGKI
jgi:oligoendopeptidase F